ncbi:hypothetical protein OHU34_01835 [Streptomyces sp. NBC_00080]|uniref:hypothetical protein n=1 Tax=unclassified Streptomyces TaxID=2593676 RepID=UPI00114E19F1|nr:hypothetical protein [Streptomyces sp. SLBN-115]TQJ37594.1 hypothetical protein FBY34_8426 [Streptomyces sp. SLBN-115]
MGDISAERRRILQSPPPELVAEAAANPGGSVAVIDPDLIGDPDGYVPGEAVQGVWRVGEDGKLTGEFVENPNYGPPKDDFAKLTDSEHWLGWLGGQPGVAVRDSIAGILDEQVPGAVLEWMKVLDVPRYLTGGRPQPDDESNMIVTRAGLALSFALSVTSPGRRREILQGVFSWVAVRLDQPGRRKDQVWLDLRADLDWAETELRNRIYRVGQAPAPGTAT